MEAIAQHIKNINSKLQELLKKHASLVKETGLQQQTIQQLQQEIELKNNRIRLLEEQQHILKSAAGKMTGPDKKAFELVINKYIRDIDKCISFLND